MSRSSLTVGVCWVGLFFAFALAACGGDDAGIDASAPADAHSSDATDDTGTTDDAGGDADVTTDADVTADAGEEEDAGAEADASAEPDAGPACDCDDGVACTIDACAARGACTHTPAASRCGARQRCTATGCIAALVCSVDADCPRDSDPCTTLEHCDTPSRTCTWSIIDGDVDGEVPLICGGTDCDDSRADVASIGIEICNGIDDDCDGTVDTALDVACAGESVCVDGSCGCATAADTLCAEACVDLVTDGANCGACGRSCGRAGACIDSRCTCPTTTYCGGSCTDTATDSMHCGTCGHACPSTASCVGGVCACPAGQTACGAQCVVLATNADNCGGCDRACASPATCSAGTCSGGTRWALQLRATTLSVDAIAAFGTTTVVAGRGGGDLGYGRAYSLGNIPSYSGSSGGFAVGIDDTGMPSWVRTFPYTYANYLYVRNVFSSSGGMIFVGGQTGSVDYGNGFVLPSAANRTTVVWMGPDGTTQAASSFASSAYYTVVDTAAAPDGSVDLLVSMAGAFTFAGVSFPAVSTARAVLVRFAADGTPSCAVPLGELPYGASLGAASAGSAVIGGRFNGMITIGSSTLSSDPSGDVYLARVDSSCALVSVGSIDSAAVTEISLLGPAPGTDLLARGTSAYPGRMRVDGTFAWVLPGAASYSLNSSSGAPVVAGLQADPTWNIGLAASRWPSSVFVARLDPATGRALRGWQLPASSAAGARWSYSAVGAVATDNSFRVAFSHETASPLLPFSYPATTTRDVTLVVALDP